MQIDFASREVTVKLVYYGPALSGKTTNLMALHAAAGPDAGGRLVTLETRDDRTLFFDLLPLVFRSTEGSSSLRVKLFTVPGQPIHVSTRKLVLQGADGVALIADSRVSETENNATSFFDLRENLKVNGMEIAKLPLVIQFNKRDLPDIRSDKELAEIAARGKEPVFSAVARTGEGVVETLLGLLHLTWLTLDKSHDLSNRLGMNGADLLAAAARQLNAGQPVSSLLAKSMGGSYRPVGAGSP